MFRLAIRNLAHDRIRLAVTLTGIVFAVVLIVVQVGLFIGFTRATSGLIDHSGADLWIMAERVPYLEQGVEFSERKLQQVRAVPGIIAAEKYIARFSQWKRPDGGQEGVFLVGFNPANPLGGPWNLVEGRVEDIKAADAVIVDRLYKKKLGVTRLGEVFEIRGRRARVVGFTEGIRPFTTSPYIFTSFKNAQEYAGIPEDRTLFVLARVAPGAEVAAVRRAVAARVRDVDVHTSAGFSRMTTVYWMFTTGAGVAVLMAAVLGLVVGVVVVAQTIYATTMDHLREFGTLKAIGASNAYLYRVILKQAAVAALLGYALGMAVSAIVVRGSRTGGAAIELPPEMVVAMFFLTVGMCAVAAIVSINKVTRLDPAMVFKA